MQYNQAMTKPMDSMLDSLYTEGCLLPKACSWYVVELVYQNPDDGLTYETLKEKLISSLKEYNETKPDFLFSFGPEVSLRDILERFVEDEILEQFDTKYIVTNKGKRNLKEKVNLIKNFIPI